MRTLCLIFVCSISLLAQRGRGGGEAPVIPPGPPKNLKILPADVNIQQTMGAFRTALGVQCTYCHVQGDFASDDNPKKNMARNMLRIAADINAHVPRRQAARDLLHLPSRRGETEDGTACSRRCAETRHATGTIAPNNPTCILNRLWIWPTWAIWNSSLPNPRRASVFLSTSWA